MKDDISMNQSIAHSHSKSTWTPYVQLPEHESQILTEIDTKLSTTLETLNKSLEMAKGKFPQIKDSFVSMRDGIQRLAEQTIKLNKAFHIVKHQLQAHTEALNDNIESLTTDIDKLRILVRNIRNDNFDSGNYLDIFSELATRITSHLSETHNSKGEDINEFCELTWCAVNIITKLDPAARNAYLWSTQSKEISDALRTEKNHKKLACEKDNKLLETI
jgi:chromosome segregation ATPase